MNRKVTVVGGAGNVGAAVARCIVDKGLADVVIVDIADQKAAGVALDMLESCPITGSGSRVIGGADYAQTAGSDVVVITSGVPRKPGMSRDDLLNVNFKIMQSVTEQIVKYSPNTIIVPVANPLDAMCQAVYRLSKFPRERVIGMAGILDSARMRAFIAMETGVSVENIHAFVLGGHGDTMVPLPRYSTIAGIPLPDYPGLSKETIDAIGVPFDHVVAASEIGSYKPAPRHWEVFVAQTGVAPGGHVHDAQSAFHDIATAASLGLPSVWINRLGEPPGPPCSRELPDLVGLADALDELAPT